VGPLPLEWSHLLAAAALVAVAVGCTRTFRLGLEVDYLWAAARTVAQLLLVGYVLLWIFDQDAVAFVALAFAVMLGTATWTAARRVGYRVPGIFASTGFALSVGCGLTTFAVTALVVRADPWWAPRYFLPLAGMIVGNSMNAAALTAERLASEIASRERQIDELLALGASPRQAVAPALRAAMRAALIPTINSMLTVGLVALPGMMTGQMIAGADPNVAARYQIVVMFMLASATTISAVMLGAMLYGRFFTAAWQLRRELIPGES